ncbi:hypothetical protein FS749_006238 [Ceratobasidium sp. UAMH 11750]|nr:hypothetical protein FS749_006238 [Ceratobasidium sp. UAMH 11750]
MDTKPLCETTSGFSSSFEALPEDLPSPPTSTPIGPRAHEPSLLSKTASGEGPAETWEPRFLIPQRGHLFVNVIEHDGSTLMSRSSIFSRSLTQPRGRLTEAVHAPSV